MRKAEAPKPIDYGGVKAAVMKARGPDNSGRWYWRARRKTGDRAMVWSGRATRDEALREVMRAVDSGTTSSRSAAPIRTVSDLLNTWDLAVQADPGRAKSTKRNYEKASRHIIAWMGDVLISRVGAPTIEDYRNSRLREGGAPRTVELELKVLRIAWNWGRRRGLAEGELPQVRVAVDRSRFKLNHHTPSEGEVTTLLAAVKDPDWRFVVQLLATTGARVGELMSCRASDFDRQNAVLHFGRHEGARKTGHRVFPLPAATAQAVAHAVDERPPDEFLVIPKLTRLESRKQAVRGHLRRACKRSRIPVVTPHGLRRYVVNKLIRAGVDPATAASLTGHNVQVMLQFYREVSERDQREALARAGLGVERSKVIEGPWER